MIAIFQPDYSIDTVVHLLTKNLLRGTIYLFFDFDNTLMPWGSDYLSDNIIYLLEHLIKDGKKIYIVSNGKSKRLKKVFSSFSDRLILIPEANKPLNSKIYNYIKSNNINPYRSMFIGDNLITDIWLGNRLSMMTVKVKPISRKEYFLTKIYRIMEFIVINIDGKLYDKRLY